MDNYGIVTAGTQTLTEGNWFVEEGRVNLAAPLVVEGDVTLHLAEGAVLNAAKGIVVSKGNSLTVLGVGDILAQGEVLAAGIGGANGQDAGEIVLKTSGMATVTGGELAAGIGGGYTGAGGTVTINGGTVTATGGSHGAGIGGGYGSSSDGNVNWDEEKVWIVDGGVGSGHPYVKFVEIGDGPICAGGEIAEGEGGVWFVTPNAGVTEVAIAGLPEGAIVAVPPTVAKVKGVGDAQIRIYVGGKDVTGEYHVNNGVIEKAGTDESEGLVVIGFVPVHDNLGDRWLVTVKGTEWNAEYVLEGASTPSMTDAEVENIGSADDTGTMTLKTSPTTAPARFYRVKMKER